MESIGPKIELKGEQQFRQALREIDAGLKVNSSEMKLLTAEYGKNNSSVEALTAKQDILERTISSQAEKVETLRARLQAAAQSYGEADTKTMAWQEKLNGAEAELAGLNGQLTENEKSLKRAQSGTVSLNDMYEKLADVTGLRLPSSLENVISKMDGVTNKSMAVAGAIGGVVTIITGLTKASLDMAASAKEIETASQRVGMSAEEYQKYSYALQQSGSDISSLDEVLRRQQTTLAQAQAGSKDAKEGYRELGIMVKGLSADEAFDQVVKKLAGIDDESRRNAIAAKIFGESYGKLSPLLNEGAGGIQNLKDEAVKLGAVMSDETIEAGAKMQESLDKLKDSAEGLKNKLGEILLPALTKIFDVISSIPQPVMEVILVVGGAVTIILSLSKAFTTLAAAGTALGVSNMILGASFTSLLPVLAIIAGTIILIIGLYKLLKGSSKEASSDLNNMQSQLNDLKSSAASISTANVPQYAKGTDFHPGGLAIVGEQGPELVQLPRGSRVYPNRTGIEGGQMITVNVRADDLQQMADVVRLFDNLKRMTNAGEVMA